MSDCQNSGRDKTTDQYADFSNVLYMLKILTCLIKNINKFFIESNNFYWKDPYILNYKKRIKLCKLLEFFLQFILRALF